MVSEGCCSSSLTACVINAPKKSPNVLSGAFSSGDVAMDLQQGFHQAPVECFGFPLLKSKFLVPRLHQKPHELGGHVGVAAVLGLSPGTVGTPGPLLSSAAPNAVVKQWDWES